MSKEVTVEELRERLDEIIAEVEAGESVTLLKDGVGIASVTPVRARRGVEYPFRNFDFGHRPLKLTLDVVELIREDRDSELKKYSV